MKRTEKWDVTYEMYDEAGELPDSDQQLLHMAAEACNRSYAPYSNFRVGAAVLLENGEIIVGANQENASFPLGNCGEHVALNAANVAHPDVPVTAVAIRARYDKSPVNRPVMPCGGCRQVLCESERRFDKSIRIILMGESGKIAVFHSAMDLLPFAFEFTE